ALAEVYWPRDLERVRQFTREALEAKNVPADVRALSLLLQADCRVKERNFQPAIVLLEELVRLRRYSEDWRLLGVCYLFENQPQKALQAFQQAAAIRPYRPDVHDGLAEVYDRLGDAARARDHRQKAEWLLNLRQQ